MARLSIGVLVLASAGCAVPVPPTGGPADTTPPTLVGSEPAGGTVRFAGDRVVLRFDEYVDERSARSSVQITPTPVRPPEIRYGGRRIEIRFREPLRDSTTYIVTLDTGFRDAHGAALRTPIQVAFSTGDVIDSGRLAGRVVDAITGAAAGSVDVFAYPVDPVVPHDSLPPEPAYRTQTDTEGRFALSHLAERPFLVVAVRDANRNRSADPDEAVATPPFPALVADSAGAEPSAPWLLARLDTTPPDLRRTAARSSSRIEMLFSEGVLTGDPERITVSDSAGARTADVILAGFRPGDERTLVVRTGALAPGWWTVRGDSAVADSAGNVLGRFEGAFAVPSNPDTARARFRAFAGDTLGGGPPGFRVLAPWSPAIVRVSDVVHPDSLLRSIAVRDTSGAALDPVLEPVDGSSYGLRGTERPFDVTVHPPLADSVIRGRFMAAPATLLGELSGIVTGGAPVVVELYPAGARQEPVHRAMADGAGHFRFDRLPGGRRYRLRAFVDLDGDGRWSPGRPAPWEAAEPATWLDAVPAVRARWETALPDTVRIGLPLPGVGPRGE